MSLLTVVPFKIFSTTLTSSFKRKSASLFFVILQINFTAVLDPPFPGSVWICIALGQEPMKFDGLLPGSTMFLTLARY